MNVLTQRFFAAARICSSELSIKQRLTDAWMLHLDEVSPAELPRCHREKFVALREVLYERKPLPAESAPEASIRKMSGQQVASCTDLIVTIFGELTQAQSDNNISGKDHDNHVGSGVVTNLKDRLSQQLN
jgi:hypothetical protein